MEGLPESYGSLKLTYRILKPKFAKITQVPKVLEEKKVPSFSCQDPTS